MSWRLAESLEQLRRQINAAYPKRDKTSDGGIGDAAHASRKSDHNPWVHDGRQGVVTAIDIDEDLGGNVTLQKIIDSICASRDERVKYIIYEGRITVAGSKLQRWKKYTGKNAHKQHAHISVESSKKLYDNTADWDLGIPAAKPVAAALKDLTAEIGESPSVNSASYLPEVIASGTANLPEPSNVALPVESPQPSNNISASLTDASDVDLRKERPSIFTKISTAIAAVTGFFLSIGVNIQSLLDKASESITVKQIAFLAFGIGLVGVAYYFYDRSAQRANKLNQQNAAIAADRGLNTVRFKG